MITLLLNVIIGASIGILIFQSIYAVKKGIKQPPPFKFFLLFGILGAIISTFPWWSKLLLDYEIPPDYCNFFLMYCFIQEIDTVGLLIFSLVFILLFALDFIIISKIARSEREFNSLPTID